MTHSQITGVLQCPDSPPLRYLSQFGSCRPPSGEIERYLGHRYAETAHAVPGGAQINAPNELAHPLSAALILAETGGLHEIIQANHAVGNQNVREKSFRVLFSSSSSYRTPNYRNDDRNILPTFPVAVLPFYIRVNSSRMDDPAQATRIGEAIAVELMHKIG